MRRLLAVAALALFPQEKQDEGTLLATIPEGLEVASELVPTTSLTTFVSRSSIAWSADGKLVAYAARRTNEQWLPVVGNDVGESYDFVGTPIVAGGHAIFHVVRTQTPSTQLSWIWIDGATLDPEDWLGEIAVDAAGRQVAYWTQPGAKVGSLETPTRWVQYLTLAEEKKPGKWTVTKPKDSYYEAAQTAPVFSADGRRVYSTGTKSGGGVVLLERTGPRMKELTDKHHKILSIAFSADAKAFAYVALSADGAPPELFFKDKSIGHPHERNVIIAVDPAGKQVAYVAKSGKGVTVAIGTEKPSAKVYDHVLELAFSPDGTQLAFVANVGGTPHVETPGVIVGGQEFVVIRPTAGDAAWTESAHCSEARDLVWSADGKLAHAARTEEVWRIVCGSKTSADYDDVGRPVFGVGAPGLTFGARKARELWWKRLPLE